MHAKFRLAALVLLAAAAGCADHEPTTPGDTPAAGPGAVPAEPNPSPEAHRLEHHARQLALALSDPALREYLYTQLRESPVVEHKLQFQRLLQRDDRRIASAMARAEGQPQAAVMQEASASIASELYFPVPGHLQRWDGGPDLLVATALKDHDVPVAFNTRGERILLDPRTPPATPVLALVPQETDFDRPTGRMDAVCQVDDCGGNDPGAGGGWTGGGSTGTGTGGGPTGAPPNQSLYLTRAQFVDTFESWLKGNPEFELHVLGPASTGDSSAMISYQCVGEHAPSGYTWDMNSTSWSGSAKVFSQAQMDALEQAYPGRSYLIMALEDDDTACEIKMGQDRISDLFTALRNAYQSYIAVKDIKVVSINGVTRIIVAAKSGARLISALASVIKTNDDLIGVAVADSVLGRTSSVGHWAVLEGTSKINGWLNLEMK